MTSKRSVLNAVILGVCFHYVSSCCVNITVAVVNERSPVLDLPAQLNRTIGIIERAMNKTREILQYVANVDFIIRNLDAPTCTNSHWGALLADLYYQRKIDAIIGPGKINRTLIYIFLFYHIICRRGAVAWWLTPRTPDPEIGVSSPTRVVVLCP